MNIPSTVQGEVVLQDYFAYTEEQHLTWSKLFEMQLSAVKGRACQEFITGLEMLEELIRPLPNLEVLSSQLEKVVGWKLVPVIGFLNSKEYFSHLANKAFPVTTFIREINNFGFDSVPDMWHDIFGHVPLLTQPLYSKSIEYISQKVLVANETQRQQLANLYWYTIEAGVCQENGQRRVYGGSQLSSFDEIYYAVSDQPKVQPFDFKLVIQSEVKIDEFQNTLFEIPTFEYLAEIIAQIDWLI